MSQCRCGGIASIKPMNAFSMKSPLSHSRTRRRFSGVTSPSSRFLYGDLGDRHWPVAGKHSASAASATDQGMVGPEDRASPLPLSSPKPMRRHRDPAASYRPTQSRKSSRPLSAVQSAIAASRTIVAWKRWSAAQSHVREYRRERSGDTRQKVPEVIDRAYCRYRTCRIWAECRCIDLSQRRRLKGRQNFLGITERRSV